MNTNESQFGSRIGLLSGKGNVKVDTTGLYQNLGIDQKTFNSASAKVAEGVKSGAIAKETAAKVERNNKSSFKSILAEKQPTVKINSAK